MKKKLLLSLLSLGTAAMLCGFDSAETLDSLSEKSTAAQQDLETLSANIGFNADAAVIISDGTTDSSIGFVGNGAFLADYSMKPFGMKMDGSMQLSMMGQNETMTEKAYATSAENGDMKMYVYVEDSTTGEGSWTVQTMDGLNIDELIAQSSEMSVSFSEMAEWGLEFTLAPEAADVDGTECYMISGAIEAADFGTMLDKAAEMVKETGEELPTEELDEVKSYLDFLEGLKLNMTYYIDAATYLPVKFHMDMNDSDLSIINVLINSMMGSEDEENPSTASLALNDLSMDISFTYGGEVDVTVPEEALAAEANGDVISLDDLNEEVMEDVAE